ncbi:MAG: class I SAM-dependent methyltransferase [Patescibacteria group bacterium]
MKDHPLWENDKLGAGSEFYNGKASVYEEFSQAEDAPKKVVGFLASKMEGKVVLDFGCGTGKFISEFAPLAKTYWAVDISENQLAIARKKAGAFHNVKFLKNDENTISLESDSVDVIFASWVIGSIHNLDLRARTITELRRILKLDGSIYLVENDVSGEFKNIIEGEAGNGKTRIKQEWLEKSGFRKAQSFETFFEFRNLETAKGVFKIIWGDEIAAKISSEKITHNIAIYESKK